MALQQRAYSICTDTVNGSSQQTEQYIYIYIGDSLTCKSYFLLCFTAYKLVCLIIYSPYCNLRYPCTVSYFVKYIFINIFWVTISFFPSYIVAKNTLQCEHKTSPHCSFPPCFAVSRWCVSLWILKKAFKDVQVSYRSRQSLHPKAKPCLLCTVSFQTKLFRLISRFTCSQTTQC